MTMKRLVSLLLAFCLLVPCLGLAEQLDEPILVEDVENVFTDVPEEVLHDEEALDFEIVIPEEADLQLMPSVEVGAPQTYRELVLLQPTNLIGAAQGTSSVRLSWGPVAFATSYDVMRKVQGQSAYTRVASTPSTQLYYDDTVTPGTVVYYRVRAVNTAYDGETPVNTFSPESNTLPFIALEKPTQNDPRGIDSDSIRLSWSSVSGANGYDVEMAEGPSGPFSVARKDLTGTLCNVDGLTAGEGYYFRVRAYRLISSGEKYYSDYSNVTCGTPMDIPALSVSADNIRTDASGNTKGNAVLSWTKSAGATKYVIYRKVGTSGSYSKLTIVDDVTTYVDANLTAGQVYYYYVYAMKPVGSYNCFSVSSTKRYFSIIEACVINAVEQTAEGEHTINWTGPNGKSTVAGATSFQVYCAEGEDGLFTLLGTSNTTKYVATGRETGKTYYYKVRAVRSFSNGDVSYGPWSAVMSLGEQAELTLTGLSATNATVYGEQGVDVSGGYVGDVFSWTVKANGGTGEYAFRWSLVSLTTGTELVLRNFPDSYITIPEGEDYATDSYSFALSESMIDLVNNQKYAMQVAVLDSEGNVTTLKASEASYSQMNHVAAKPVTKTVSVTLRVGDTLDLEHGIVEAAGDSVIMDMSNPTGAVSLTGNTVTAVKNGYANILITPARYENDILIVYDITVGYAALTLTSVTPNMTTATNHDTLAWDISYTGGRPDYAISFRVYRDDVVVASNNSTASTAALMSVNYQPTAAGKYALEVTITSADNQTVTKRSAVTTVKLYNPVTLTSDLLSTTVGTKVTWTSKYTGEATVIKRDYSLYCDGVLVASTANTNEETFSFTPANTGSYVLKLALYEDNGTRVEVTAATVTITAGEAGAGTGKVTGVRVALRKGPGTGYGIILRVEKGETITFIKSQDGWYYVDYMGTKGWMMARYIKLN